MQLANDVYIWWFWGLGGLGGWSLFLLLTIIAASYVYFDSANREIKAVGWRLGATLPILLFVPTLLFRFSNPRQPIDLSASEWFLVVGVLGTVLSIAAAVGYAVTYWGVTPEPEKPHYAAAPQAPPAQPAPRPAPRPAQPAPQAPPPPANVRRDEAGAWLVDDNGRQYSLFVGDTRIGRRSQSNDIVLEDPTVSREQALIRDDHNVFKLYDRGSTTGTYVNDKRIREPVILYHGDVIEMGDVRLTFVSSQQ